jgi:metal-sulfur cluster biosynthetic enzyme
MVVSVLVQKWWAQALHTNWMLWSHMEICLYQEYWCWLWAVITNGGECPCSKVVSTSTSHKLDVMKPSLNCQLHLSCMPNWKNDSSIQTAKEMYNQFHQYNTINHQWASPPEAQNQTKTLKKHGILQLWYSKWMRNVYFWYIFVKDEIKGKAAYKMALSNSLPSLKVYLCSFCIIPANLLAKIQNQAHNTAIVYKQAHNTAIVYSPVLIHCPSVIFHYTFFNVS